MVQHLLIPRRARKPNERKNDLVMGVIPFGSMWQALQQLEGLPVVVDLLGTRKELLRSFRRCQRIVKCLFPLLGSEPVQGQERRILADRRSATQGRYNLLFERLG